MVAAQTDGHVPNIDDCVHLWRQKELQVISEISIKPRRRPDCIVSTARNYLHGNTDINTAHLSTSIAMRLDTPMILNCIKPKYNYYS